MIDTKTHNMLEKYCKTLCTGKLGWNKERRKDCRNYNMCTDCQRQFEVAPLDEFLKSVKESIQDLSVKPDASYNKKYYEQLCLDTASKLLAAYNQFNTIHENNKKV